MDKSTGDTLSAIDRILAEWADDTLKHGETTSKIVQKQFPHIPVSTITKRLDARVDKGELSCRVANIDGHKTKVYGEPIQPR